MGGKKRNQIRKICCRPAPAPENVNHEEEITLYVGLRKLNLRNHELGLLGRKALLKTGRVREGGSSTIAALLAQTHANRDGHNDVADAETDQASDQAGSDS